MKRAVDFTYLRDDIGDLISESAEGTARVRKIVQDLRDFSRTDASQDWQPADIHQGLDSTLNIASNEIKYKADVVREYGTLPVVECLPSQLNQVFMNLFVNAAQAMPDGRRGTIHVRTGTTATRCGSRSPTTAAASRRMSSTASSTLLHHQARGKGHRPRPVLSYGIVQNHHGNITASSSPETGTCFRITLPVHHMAVPENPHDAHRPATPDRARRPPPPSILCAWMTKPTSCRPCAGCSAPTATPYMWPTAARKASNCSAASTWI